MKDEYDFSKAERGKFYRPGAVLNPPATDYLYFVSDNQGHHRFSRTASEHARNVTAYRKATAQSLNR